MEYSNIKRLRLKSKLTQSKLAAISDIKLNTLQKYEQGVKDIRKAEAYTIFKLSKALGVSMEMLLELNN